MQDSRSVGEAGEAGTLAAVLAELRPADAALLGPGDDAAVLRARGDLVVTSDTMIEGPDFRRAWHTGAELGWKLAATNLSDVAAMGARPIALTVSFACPPETPVATLAEVSRGLDEACRVLAPGCGVVGGDLGTAPVLIAAVTALGDLEGRPPVRRSGARPGDTLAYAGQLGLATLGLDLLFRRARDPDGVAHGRTLAELRAAAPAALAAQLTPRPPVHLGAAASLAGATAMLDVSDGLSLDAARLARASGVTIDLDPALLTRHFGHQEGQSVPFDAMLTGGEDHGLLAAFPPGAAQPSEFYRIGSVRGAGPAELLVAGAATVPRGWDPFTSAPAVTPASSNAAQSSARVDGSERSRCSN